MWPIIPAERDEWSRFFERNATTCAEAAKIRAMAEASRRLIDAWRAWPETVRCEGREARGHG